MPITTPSLLSPFAPHWSHYPRTYVAPYAPSPITIDGDLTKEVWSKAPWSQDFDDIRGAADSAAHDRPRPSCRTRFKMLWDEEFLYIGAEITSDFETVATFTERNSPIFQHDSDFEVFVDPNGSCHQYKELELNAINTVWNLMINKPYGNGGAEHSARISKPGDEFYYEVYNQKSATRVLKGDLNNPTKGATYTVEIAMAHNDTLADVTTHRAKDDILPGVGRHWRINFSRVEKKGVINWTWQPQIVWNAEQKRFSGYVDMHRPDAWGYLIFGDENSGGSSRGISKYARDITWPPRLAAMNIYYAQRLYKSVNGNYASTMDQLSNLVDGPIVQPFEVTIELENDGFLVSVKGNPDNCIVTITDDRLLTVIKKSSTVMES